jgi:hypothetical protein
LRGQEGYDQAEKEGVALHAGIVAPTEFQALPGDQKQRQGRCQRQRAAVRALHGRVAGEANPFFHLIEIVGEGAASGSG